MTNNNTLPDFMIELQKPLPGELPGEHLARAILAFEGCSVINNRAKLNDLFLSNESNPQSAAQTALIQTNCGTSARSILALAGCQNKYITQPYQSGMAISWLMQAGYDCGAVVDCTRDSNAWKQLDTGWLIHYQSPGSNNDHIEWCITRPDPLTGIAKHGGGGRASNAITIETGDIRHSLGRPIAQIFNPAKWGLAILSAIVAPTPDPIIPEDPAPVAINPIPIDAVPVAAANNSALAVINQMSGNKTFMVILNWIFLMLKKLFNVK